MPKKPEIQYVGQFYIHGSEALAPALAPAKKKRPVQQAPVQEEPVAVHLDLLAVCATVVAVALLVLLAVGVKQYQNAYRQMDTMKNYVITLQNDQIALKQERSVSAAAENLEQKALGLGLVPKSEVQVVKITPVVPEIQREMSFWEELRWYFDGWFA